MKDIQKLVKRAVNEWGEANNFNQATEELGELIVAINHYRRGRISPEELMEEIADVTIIQEVLLELLSIHTGFSVREHAYRIFEEKMKKLEGKLSKEPWGLKIEPGGILYNAQSKELIEVE